MVGLLDIAAITRKVDVRGKEVVVKGISARAVAKLLDQFPDLRKIVAGMSDETTTANLSKLAPEIIIAIIAAGCGLELDEKTEAAMDNLTLGEQMDLLVPIVELTFPRGFGPFIASLNSLSSGGQRTTPQQRSSGKVAAGG